METLHIFKSDPDSITKDLVQMISGNDQKIIPLYEENTDWHDVVQEILDHEKIICWW